MEFFIDDEEGNGSHFYNFSMSSNNAKILFQQPSDRLLAFGKAVEGMNLFGIPFIIVVGCVGNSLSLTVFCATNLRWQSSSVYLAFLNTVDILFLLCLIITWLGFIDVNLVHNDGWCQVTLYLSFMSGFLSVYAVVAFTVERWIVVFYPLKRTVWCTRKRALTVLACLILFSLVLYSYACWGYGVTEIGNTGIRRCHDKASFYTVVQIMTVIDSVMTLLLPSAIIITLNVGIGIKIWHLMRLRRQTSHGLVSIINTTPNKSGTGKVQTNPLVQNNNNNSKRLKQQYKKAPAGDVIEPTNLSNQWNKSRFRSTATRQRSKLKTTRSLIVVSSVFVVLNLPSHAFKLSVIIKELLGYEMKYSMESLMWQHVCQIVYYSNFAVNYYLYCACSKSFRQASCRLFRSVLGRLQNCYNDHIG